MLGVSENSACTLHIRWNDLVTFQGQLKRLLVKTIKTAYFSIFRSGLRKTLLQSFVELHRQA